MKCLSVWKGAKIKGGEIWDFWPRGRKLKGRKLKGAEITGRWKLKGVRYAISRNKVISFREFYYNQSYRSLLNKKCPPFWNNALAKSSCLTAETWKNMGRSVGLKYVERKWYLLRGTNVFFAQASHFSRFFYSTRVLLLEPATLTAAHQNALRYRIWFSGLEKSRY